MVGILVLNILSVYVLFSSARVIGELPANPDLVCGDVVSKPEKWYTDFKPMTGFNGIFRADGVIQANVAGPYEFQPITVLNITGAIWRQYFGSDGRLWGLFYFNVEPYGLILVSNSTNHIVKNTNTACIVYYPPSAEQFINDIYSENYMNGDRFFTSTYYSKIEDHFGTPVSQEFFNWPIRAGDSSSEYKESYNIRSEWDWNGVTLQTFLTYKKLALGEEQALGFTETNQPSAPFAGHHGGLKVGHGVVPIAALPQQTREFLQQHMKMK